MVRVAAGMLAALLACGGELVFAGRATARCLFPPPKR